MKNVFLYWIRLPEHTDPTSQGYVGVTKQFNKRIADHYNEVINNTHVNNHLVYAINKYGWENMIKEILMTDEESVCYLKENELRPTKNIGWNISPGGHRGPGRKKGQLNTKESIEKGKETRRLRNERIALGNPSEADLVYLERLREKKQITQEKKLHKARMATKKREAKKAERLLKEKLLKESRLEKRKQPKPRPLCQLCNCTPAKTNGKSKHGFTLWHKYCATCSKIAYDERYNYLKTKKLTCECCNFQAKDICQMELVYKDGNRKNKTKSNMKTYCSNCFKLHKKMLKVKKLLSITVDADVIIN